MKKYTETQTLYRNLKSIYKKIVDLKPYEKFNRVDFFYLLDEKCPSLGIFCDSLIKSNPGIQFFINKDGLSHLNDLIKNSNTYGFDKSFGNLSAVSFVGKEDLDEDDKKFIKKMGCNVTEKNLLVYTIKEGYGMVEPTKTDLEELTFLCKYMLCLVENETETLVQIFEKEYMLLATFNNEQMTYNIKAIPEFEFDNLPSMKKAHQPFIDEVSKYNYRNEKCYMTRLYLPIKDNPNGYFYSVIFLYLEKEDLWLSNIFECKPKKVNDYMYSFLDDIFKKYGIFDEIIISDRFLYSGLYKTLKKLNVDVKYERTENDFTKYAYKNMIEMLSNISKIGEELAMEDADIDANSLVDRLIDYCVDLEDEYCDESDLEEEYFESDDNYFVA